MLPEDANGERVEADDRSMIEMLNNEQGNTTF